MQLDYNFINTSNFTRWQPILLCMMLMVLLFNGEPSSILGSGVGQNIVVQIMHDLY